MNDYIETTKERIHLIYEHITISPIVKRKALQSFIFLSKKFSEKIKCSKLSHTRSVDLRISKCCYEMREDARFKRKASSYQY